MPDCNEETGDKTNGEEDEEPDTVSFALTLSNPLPEGVKLSKRSTCYINIEITDEAAELAADYERRKLLDFFVASNEMTWSQQFKNACILGPVID